MSDWLTQLKSHFGDSITDDTAALAIAGVAPACAAAPRDDAEVSALIRFAAANKIAVVPVGNGTAQGAIAPPPNGYMRLSTKRLNKLIHHEPGDMVATVQAGMTLKDFQDAITARGQWLPIDAPADATIGGIVAGNVYGPRSLGYGSLRDMILGMTVINGDGVARKCGGKVVKNVTGYALDKLYIGSQGTLGVITEVTFKLRPLSVDGRQWHAEFSSLKQGVEALRAIALKNLPLEMLRLTRPKSGPMGAQGLSICAAGTDAELNRIESELKSAVPNCAFETIAFNPDHAKEKNYTRENWAYSQSLTWGSFDAHLLERARARSTPGATLRFGCVPSNLDAVLDVLAPHVNAQSSIGTTGGLIEIAPLDELEAARITVEFETLGVNFAFENVVGLKLKNRWGTPRQDRPIMAQIKSALDPQGIMNPGRFAV